MSAYTGWVSKLKPHVAPDFGIADFDADSKAAAQGTLERARCTRFEAFVVRQSKSVMKEDARLLKLQSYVDGAICAVETLSHPVLWQYCTKLGCKPKAAAAAAAADAST
jgi:hypothetical protein